MQKMWARGLWIIRTTLEKSSQSMANSNNTQRLVSLILQDQCKWPPPRVEKGPQLMACYQWWWEGCLTLWTCRESQWQRCARGKKKHLPQCSAGASANVCQGTVVERLEVGSSVGSMQRWAWRKLYRSTPRMANFKDTEGYDYNKSRCIEQWL